TPLAVPFGSLSRFFQSDMSRTASRTPRAREALNGAPNAPGLLASAGSTTFASRSNLYCNGSLLPDAYAISSINDWKANETPFVLGARIAPVGMLNGAMLSIPTRKLATNPRGNSLDTFTPAALGVKSRNATVLPDASKPALKK